MPEGSGIKLNRWAYKFNLLSSCQVKPEKSELLKIENIIQVISI